MVEVCTTREQVTESTVGPAVIVYEPVVGTEASLSQLVGGGGASATYTYTANQAVVGSTDYRIDPNAFAVSVRVYEGASGVARGDFTVLPGLGGAGLVNAAPPTVEGKSLTITFTAHQPGTWYVFVYRITATVLVRSTVTEQVCGTAPTVPLTGTVPTPEHQQTGYQVGWRRYLRPEDVTLGELVGEKVLATRSWLGWAGRRMLVEADVGVVEARDGQGGEWFDHTLTLVRYPGTTTSGGNLYLTFDDPDAGFDEGYLR